MDDPRIARTEIGSSDTEPNSPDPVLETYFRQQLELLYAEPFQGLAANDATNLGKHDEVTVEQAQFEGEEAYEFRLFTTSSALGPASLGGGNVPHRIALRSPSPAGGGSRFTARGRPDEYYFADHAGLELAEQYLEAAVSGQDIIDGLKMKWRGMELPWRVTVINSTRPGEMVGPEHQLQAQSNRTKRTGKKRRIMIRKRIEAKAAQKVAAIQTQAENLAAEREKRTRKNREKKVRRRQKDKLKKATDVQNPTLFRLEDT